MNIDVFFSAITQMFDACFGKIILYVGEIPISIGALLIAFIAVPIVFHTLIPWFDDDDDGGE